MANEPSTSRDPHEIHEQGPCLKPKHEIFLSHSGAQKNFTEQLCKDLKSVGYRPFFDKEVESLPKGEKFPPLLFEAVRECHVAILVLSEEFFSSKWPMMELSEFVEAQALVNSGLKILPLFLGLNVKQVKDADNQKRWQGIWQGWADEEAIRGVEKGRINVGNWMKALLVAVGQVNGMEYNAGVGEVTYREDVVGAVCRLVPPNVKFDVSHVQAMPRLCEAISKRLDERVEPSSTSGCQTVGLYAMGGSGKSTISKAMCNYKHGEFAGKVCHVEFGSGTYKELRQKVLKELMGFDSKSLPEPDKLEASLKDGMKRQMVFLALDNVWEIDSEEAKTYLRAGFKEGSKVLVTSRSLDVLKSLNLKDSVCMEMPELDEEDATNLFLYHAACYYKHFSQEQEDLIKRCVGACNFAKRDVGGLEYPSSTHQYLPLALKVWGIQLGQISEDPLKWSASLENLNNHKFNHFEQQDHPLFSLLRQGYDGLKRMSQQIFLDLALFFPQFISESFYMSGIEEKYNVVEWLKIFYNCPEERINCVLLALRRNALIEDFGGNNGLEFKIHDLYLEFARKEVKAGSFDKRRILYLDGTAIPFELRKRQYIESWSFVERLGLYKSKLKSLMKAKLHLCPNVEMLRLYECSELVEVDVQGFEWLKSLDILACPSLGTKFVGVEKLEDLVWFRWRDIIEPAPFLQDFSSLTALEVLHLSQDFWLTLYSGMKDPPNLRGCINLRKLTMESFHKMEQFPDLSNLSNLQEIYFVGFSSVTYVCGLSFSKNIKILSLRSCYGVQELPGLCNLVALEILDLHRCSSLSKLDGLEKLQHLRDLIVDLCFILSSLDGLEYLTSLRHLDAFGCYNLEEIPDCSQLQEVEMINLSQSGVCVVPDDFGRLAKSRILKISGCTSLVEPILLWWMIQLSEICETIDGWITPGFLFPEQSRSQLLQVIGDVATYYLNEATLQRMRFIISPIISHTGPNFKVLGVGTLIESLCYSENMGILSVFIAKYAATGKYWELLADESMTHITSSDDVPYHMHSTQVLLLSYKIVDFLAQQVYEMLTSESDKDQLKLLRIQFVLKHMTQNEIMATALGRNNICQFIRLCLYHPRLRRHMDQFEEVDEEDVCVRSRYFKEALERCKLGELCYLCSGAFGQSAVGPYIPPSLMDLARRVRPL